jgi:hypothetical protein
MNTLLFIGSKPPESYNQTYWLCLKQRMAWILQRWLNKGGDPYLYFDSLKTPLFIYDDMVLNPLFEGDFYQNEQFITRYVEECYWIIWRVTQGDATYFCVLRAENFYQGSMIDQYTFPYQFDKTQLIAQREQVETLLIDLAQQGTECQSLLPFRQPDNNVNNSAVYAQLSQNESPDESQGNKQESTYLTLSNGKLAYQLPMLELNEQITFLSKIDNGMWQQDIYIEAWNFASKAHCKQFMPGSDIPYINHIGLVTMEVISALAQPKTERIQHYQPIKFQNLAVVCALLHDTIEDTTVTFEDIETTFNQYFAQGVLALTKNTNLPTKREQMLDSLARIKEQPLEISMVKMADRITNLQPPPHYWTKEKINNYREEAQLILDELGKANEYLAQRLDEKIKHYKKYC